jgi:hypothetical protein
MPKCPRCGSATVQRVRRIGALEFISTFVRWCPFRCQVCAQRFHRFALAPRCWKADRRQYERLVIHIRAMIIGKPSCGNELVTDLSLGGCRLKTDSRISEGSFLHLRLQPPEPTRPITIQTVVVRSVYSDSLGLEFLGLDPRQKQYLSRFVSELLTSRSPSRKYKPHLTKPAKA